MYQSEDERLTAELMNLDPPRFIIPQEQDGFDLFRSLSHVLKSAGIKTSTESVHQKCVEWMRDHENVFRPLVINGRARQEIRQIWETKGAPEAYSRYLEDLSSTEERIRTDPDYYPGAPEIRAITEAFGVYTTVYSFEFGRIRTVDYECDDPYGRPIVEIIHRHWNHFDAIIRFLSHSFVWQPSAKYTDETKSQAEESAYAASDFPSSSISDDIPAANDDGESLSEYNSEVTVDNNQLLTEHLSSLDPPRKIFEQPGDGYCLFHSCSHALTACGIKTSKTDVHKKCVGWMRNHETTFREAVVHGGARQEIADLWSTDKSPEAYRLYLTGLESTNWQIRTDPNYFPGMAEIRAISEAFRVNTTVYSVENGRVKMDSFSPENPSESRGLVEIVNRGIHFDAVGQIPTRTLKRKRQAKASLYAASTIPSSSISDTASTSSNSGESLQAYNVSLIPRKFNSYCSSCDTSFNTVDKARQHFQNVHELGDDYIDDQMDWSSSTDNNEDEEAETRDFQCNQCKCVFSGEEALCHHRWTEHNVTQKETEDLYELNWNDLSDEQKQLKIKNYRKTNQSRNCFTCLYCLLTFIGKDALLDHFTDPPHNFSLRVAKHKIHAIIQDILLRGLSSSRIYKRKPLPNKPAKKSTTKILVDPSSLSTAGCMIPVSERVVAKKTIKKKIQRQNTKDQIYVCECGLGYMSEVALTAHIRRIHLKIINYTCKYCDKGFFDKAKYQDHVDRVHEKNFKYSCTPCIKEFYTTHELRVHNEIHHSSDLKYACGMCPKTFKTQDYLRKHQYTHLNVKMYSCPDCAQEFATRLGADEHIRSVHVRQQQYKCNICATTDKPYYAFSRQVLEIHMKFRHTNARPFLCHICGRTYQTKDHLRRHVWEIHENPSGFKCDLCLATFTSKHNRDAHIKLHASKKVHFCYTCSINFITEDEFQDHVVSEEHNNNHNGYRFTRPIEYKSDFTTHLKLTPSKDESRFTKTCTSPDGCYVCNNILRVDKVTLHGTYLDVKCKFTCDSHHVIYALVDVETNIPEDQEDDKISVFYRYFGQTDRFQERIRHHFGTWTSNARMSRHFEDFGTDNIKIIPLLLTGDDDDALNFAEVDVIQAFNGCDPLSGGWNKQAGGQYTYFRVTS